MPDPGLPELGIRGVAVYADIDRGALLVRLAGEASHLGTALPSESYLHSPMLLDAVRRHDVVAIRPGNDS